MKRHIPGKLYWFCTAFFLLGTTSICAADPRNELPKKQHRTSNAPFLTPEQAVKKMAIPDGFDVSIYAAEPDIAEPIGFCFDDRGRMWVAENFNYRTRRNHTDDPVSRIQILEDTDSDGIFDKKKTFTDTLTFTSGLAPGFGGVFVGSPPNLTFIPDADGDDVPDGPPQVLLDGWGINDRHETLNSFIWGPDGWLYGCHGVFTQSRVGKPGDSEEARQFIDGGIWRYHPTQKKFEVYARGLSNPWGFDFNDHGQGFVTCCVIPHLYHIVQGGVYTKQSRPHVNPHIYDDIKTIRTHKNRLSAHGGARIYLADDFPAKYRNRLFMCNIHEHAVLTDILTPKGSSFVGSHGDDFMPANDLAWVGFSVETGPEGGVYVLDWHDTDVCGNTINFANSGRIYRITAAGAKPIERPNLRAMSDAQLVELQSHSNDWYVRQARLLLHSRTAAGKLDSSLVHRKLNELFDDPATTSPKRLRALWALHVTEGLSKQRLHSLLDHDDEYIRGWTIQLLCDQSSIHSFQTAATTGQPVVSRKTHDKFVEMASKDESPIVRLYLASALGRLPFADRWDILKGLVSHPEDVDDHNLPRMYWFALEPMVPKHADKALTLAVSGKIPKLQEFVARRMLSGETVVDLNAPKRPQPKPEWQTVIQKVAPGFNVRNVGEGGVVEHKTFRNATAVQTHPLHKNRASSLHRTAAIPTDKKTTLHMRVSHHPHGDWQLRVLADGKMIENQLVSSKTVGKDEWMEVSVDLTPYAGKKVKLSIENHPNNWMNEWAYWNKVVIISE